MKEKNEETKEPYLGINESFDWVKGVLYDQREVAEGYNGKLALLLSVATGILGIGLPLGAKIGEYAFESWSSSFIAIVVVMVTYFAIGVLAIVGFWMRNYNTLDNPVIIREDFWKLAPWKFKEQILVHLEDAYKSNERSLKWRAWSIQAIIILLPIETLALTLAFLLGIRAG